MKLFFLLGLTAILSASVNEPLRLELFSGYRNDRIHWHLKTPGEASTQTYSELMRDVEFWENGLVLKAIHRDLTFFLRGAYGTFGRGSVFQRYSDLSFTSEQPRFQFDSDGWNADVEGYFGYAVNLTADRTYKVIFTPLIGYSAYFEELRRNNGKAEIPIIESFSSSLPGVFHLVWNGFFLGANFLIEPGGRLIFNAGYAYNIMHNSLSTALKSGLEPNPTIQSIETNSDGNPGQSGWVQIDYLLSRFWRLGFGGDIHYFSTRVIDASTDPELEKIKLRWTSFTGWFQISREL